jgi:hypothetical protein
MDDLTKMFDRYEEFKKNDIDEELLINTYDRVISKQNMLLNDYEDLNRERNEKQKILERF